MKQHDSFPAVGVDRAQVSSLVLVAKHARDGQIVQFRLAAVFFCDNMVDPMRGEGLGLWHEAVLTSIAGPLAHQSTQRRGYMCLAHLPLVPLTPLSLMAAFAFANRTKCSTYSY